MDKVRAGAADPVWLGLVAWAMLRWGAVGPGETDRACSGPSCLGTARRGPSCFGEVTLIRRVRIRQGLVRHVTAWCGWADLVGVESHGMARGGRVRWGAADLAGQGTSRFGAVGLGAADMDGFGTIDLAWRGTADPVGQVCRFLAWRDEARFVSADLVSLGTLGLGMFKARQGMARLIRRVVAWRRLVLSRRGMPATGSQRFSDA